MELEGTEIFKKIESLIKTHFNIPKDNQFPYPFDKGMDLNKHSFENSFEHFQEEAKSPSTPTNDEILHTFIKFKEYKINGKIGTPGQKDRLTFSSSIFQINNGLKNRYSEHEICDAVIKKIAPDLALRTYVDGKDNLNLKTLGRILRSHFKEPDATSLFTQLSNSKQLPSESAQEIVVRVMSLRKKFYLCLKRILRSHYKEPNVTSLFTELSNSKQLPSESAQEFVVRVMSLRQKILFSEALV